MTYLTRYRELAAAASDTSDNHLSREEYARDLNTFLRNHAERVAALVEAARAETKLNHPSPCACGVCKALTALDRDAAGGGE